MKNFLKTHIFSSSTNFACYSVLTMICGMIFIFIPFTSCGPSRAELEAKQRQGFIWNSSTGAFEKSPSAKNIYENPVEKEQTSKDEDENTLYNSDEDDIQIRIIDSCEYILWLNPHSNNSGNIIHKANCRNPIHKTKNQEQ